MQKVLVIDDKHQQVKYKRAEIETDCHLPFISLEDITKLYPDNIEEIFNYCTRGSLSLITKSGKEISINEYIPGITKVLLLKISTPELHKSGNDIFLSASGSHYRQLRIKWGSRHIGLADNTQVYRDIAEDCRNNGRRQLNNYTDFMLHDLDGYNLTTQLYEKSLKSGKKMKLAEYCLKKHIKIKHEGEYQGYIPTIGQLMFLHSIRGLVNYVFRYIGVQEIPFDEYVWWSANEFSDEHAWCLEISTMPDHINDGTDCLGGWTKDSHIGILPFFKRIK